MLFYIRQGEKEHRIRVEARRGQVFVRFDSEPEEVVDIHFYGNDVSLVREHRVFSANVVGQKHEYTVWRPSGNISYALESEYRRIVGLLRGQQLVDENHVYARMPGKIVKILAKKGDAVEQGTPVLVMEAMKMENEIRSPSSGEVRQLHVTEGQAVETGTLLAEISKSEDGAP